MNWPIPGTQTTGRPGSWKRSPARMARSGAPPTGSGSWLASARLPPTRPKSSIDPQLAAQQRLQPGSTLHLLGVPSTAKVCPPQPARPGRPPVPLAFRVSAVVAFDDQVVPAPGLGGAPRVLLSPSFWREWRRPPVRPRGCGQRAAAARHHPRSVPRRRQRAGPALPVGHAWSPSFVNLAPEQAAAQRAIRPAAVALALFAALDALLTLAVLSPLIVRQLILDAAEFPMLSALGMARTQLFGLSLALGRDHHRRRRAARGRHRRRGLTADADRGGPAGRADSRRAAGATLGIPQAGLAFAVIAPLALAVPAAWRIARLPGPPRWPGRGARAGPVLPAGQRGGPGLW